uniref:Uncharacterized protein n=1 Tax=Ciona savignyi TaxID=51511 RepID=H2Z045_CIOSA
MKPFDQQTTDTTRTSKTSNRNHLSREGKRTKPFTVDSMEQENLTQLYNNIPPQDLENLREMYRGVLGPGEDRGPDFHKQFASCSLDTERVQTFKQRQGWNSSYSDEYKNWYPCHYSADKCKTTKNVETRHKIEKEEKHPKVATLAEKKPSPMTKSVDDPPPPAEAEEKCKKISFEEQLSELKRKERDRIIKEADDIEEREFQALFEPGGKIKMDMESSSKFKAHPTKPPETPIWANKTVVSLGSGHWNLPLNKGDDWRLEEEDASVHAGNNPAYKLRFHYKDASHREGRQK